MRATGITALVFGAFRRWVGARTDGAPVVAFRRVFAAIWLAYDLIDVVWGMTERSRMWLPHERENHLLGLQLILVGCGAMLVLGRGVWTFGMAAAVARAVEARQYFPLNDFYFVAVMYLLLAHSDGGPFSAGRDEGGSDRPLRPKWVHDVLLAELAWIYFATAALKLNPDWLGGGHLFVRTQYLTLGHGWPYPPPIARALGSLAVDAALARIGVVLEIALAGILAARGRYWIGVSLAVAIHGVGALLTNVWFFSASMIAAVALLLPRTPPARGSFTASRF
jgi:hypothetical protein